VKPSDGFKKARSERPVRRDHGPQPRPTVCLAGVFRHETFPQVRASCPKGRFCSQARFGRLVHGGPRRRSSQDQAGRADFTPSPPERSGGSPLGVCGGSKGIHWSREQRGTSATHRRSVASNATNSTSSRPRTNGTRTKNRRQACSLSTKNHPTAQRFQETEEFQKALMLKQNLITFGADF